MYVITAHQRYRQTDRRTDVKRSHDRYIAKACSGKNENAQKSRNWRRRCPVQWPIFAPIFAFIRRQPRQIQIFITIVIIYLYSVKTILWRVGLQLLDV